MINVPGCPAHPDWITQIVVAVATGRGGDLALDDLQRPKTFFTSFTQTGCTRNMHFSYKVSATEFGQRKGCLFYDLGCRGPMTHSPCNRILWNRQSSKTRAGMPCMGCTEPEFPFYDLVPGTVFKTQTVMGVPKEMPTGVDKTGYIKLTAAAKAASPRLGRGRTSSWSERRSSRLPQPFKARTIAMGAAVQTLDISPVGRVEGDLDVRVEIQDGHRRQRLDSGRAVPRLRGHPARQGPAGGARRHAARLRHLRRLASDLRRLGARHRLGRRSAAQRHPGAKSRPDRRKLAKPAAPPLRAVHDRLHQQELFEVASIYEEAVKRWSPFTGTNYEIGVTISGRPVEIYALFGGQWPHSSYMVPGGVMCAPTLTDVTRAWSILEYFRRTWIEPIWLGCTMERYEEIKSYDDFMAWLDERPEHANSDLGLFWRMSVGYRRSTNTAAVTVATSAGAICRMRTNTTSRPSIPVMRRSS